MLVPKSATAAFSQKTHSTGTSTEGLELIAYAKWRLISPHENERR